MTTPFEALLAKARARIREVDATELLSRIAGTDAPIIVDVREPSEQSAGVVPGARLVPRGLLELRAAEIAPDLDAPTVVYCAGGVRSALAAATLGELGYSNVVSLAGGFAAYVQAGGPVELRASLSDRQAARYARHLSLPEVGEAGQRRLLDAKVLCIGAGGLGSPAALYLAAAGIGTLGILDDDRVDVSNLQRQLLHTEDRVGMAKVDSAERALLALNSDVRVQKHAVRLTAANALEIIAGYDVIVDGSDNFPTRYLVSDVCVQLGKPFVHGSIFRFDGQATVFYPGRGPCYRCLFPEPPPAGAAPSCREAGVLGVLPGLIGVVQAIEAIKLILGVGEPLIGRLLTFDALRMGFRELRVRRDPDCARCGDHPSQTGLLDYDALCR